MTDRDALLTYIDELLQVPEFADYGPNGLQVPGTREIQSIVTGVSAGLELFERAADTPVTMDWISRVPGTWSPLGP